MVLFQNSKTNEIAEFSQPSSPEFFILPPGTAIDSVATPPPLAPIRFFEATGANSPNWQAWLIWPYSASVCYRHGRETVAVDS